MEACLGSWIDETETGYRLHEWADYNPYQAQADSREKARKEKASKAANARWGNRQKKDGNKCSEDATSICSEMPSLTSTHPV